MAVITAAPEELNLSRAVANGCRLISRRPATLLLFSALLALAPAAVDAWSTSQPTPKPFGPAYWEHTGVRLLISYATKGLNWIFQGGVVLVAAADAEDPGLPRNTSLGLLGGRAALLFVASVATNVVVGLGTLAFVIPGLMGLAWCLSPAVVAVENRGIIGMLRRSADLTRGKRASLFGFFVAYFLLRAAVTFGMRLAVGAPLQELNVGPDWLVYGAAPAASAILSLFYAAVMASIYLELRLSHDGGVADAFD